MTNPLMEERYAKRVAWVIGIVAFMVWCSAVAGIVFVVVHFAEKFW